MERDEIKKLIKEVFQEELGKTQFGVTAVPVHTHNGTDTVKIPPTSVFNFTNLPSNNTSNDRNGVPDPYAGVVSTDNISPFADPVLSIIYPTPVIVGFAPGDYSVFNGGDAPLGSTVAFYENPTSGTLAQLWIALEASHIVDQEQFTGSLALAATSATLAVIWVWQTGEYRVKFSNGNVRQVTFTNGDTTATWTGGLSATATKFFDVTIFTQWFGVDLAPLFT